MALPPLSATQRARLRGLAGKLAQNDQQAPKGPLPDLAPLPLSKKTGAAALTPAQRARAAVYAYENEPARTGVDFLDRASKRDVEQNALAVGAGKKAPHQLDSESHLAHVTANSGLAKLTGAIVAPLNPSLPADQRMSTAWLDSSPRKGAGFGVPSILGNFVKDAARNTLGLPASLVELAQNPGGTAKAFGQSYAQEYRPLAEGHLGAFAHQVGQHPLNYLLDASAAAGLAGKAAHLDARVPEYRKLSLDGGSVQPHASPNPLARSMQHRFDRWSEAHPDAPVTGARARVARRLTYEQERDFERANASLIPFAQARAKLDKGNGEDTAFDVLYGYGDERGAHGLEQEIKTRVDRLQHATDPITRGQTVKGETIYQLRGDPGRTTLDPAEAEPMMTPQEARAQEAQIRALIAARPHVQNPSANLQAALEHGRALGDQETANRVATKVITPETAAGHAQMRARLVTGGQFVETPSPTAKLVEARTYRDRLQKLHDRAVTARDKNAQTELGRAGAKTADIDAQLAAGPKLPISREEAVARLNELEQGHEKALQLLEQHAMSTKMKPEDAQAQLDALDAKIADARKRAGDARATLAQMEKDRPRLTGEQMADRYGATRESGVQLSHGQFGLKHIATARIAERELAQLAKERNRYLAAQKTGRLKIPLDPAETARRNLLRHAGVKMPTLREELRQGVEQQLNDIVAADPTHPVAKAHIGRQQEMAQLRAALEQTDPIFGEPDASVDFGAKPDERRIAELERRRGRNELTQLAGRLVGNGKVTIPKGGARADRLGGALSVAQDAVQRLEQAAERRHGVVPGAQGGREIQGGETFPGARSLPDLSANRPTVRQALTRRARTVASKPQKLTRQSEGVLFTEGRTRRGSKVLLEHAQAGSRYRQQLADIKRAGSFSIPFDEERLNEVDHRGEPRWEIFNPEGVKLPRRLKDSTPEQLATMTPAEYQQHAELEGGHLVDDVFPSVDALRELPQRQRAKLRLLDAKVKGALETSLGAHGDTSKIGKLFDTTNNLSKTALIYLSLPKYVTTNTAGNVGYLALHQGFWAAPNIAKAAGLMGDLAPETLRRIDVEVGGGGAHALGGEGRGPIARATQGLANVAGGLADTMPRRAAWLHEAAKVGAKTDEQITDLLHNPNRSHELNQVSERAEEAMVKFRGLTPFERKVVSRAIFIYPWMKGATRYGGRLAVDRPVTADLASHAGEVGSDQAEKILGRIASYLDGLIPVGKPHGKLGTIVEDVRNPASLSPLGTAGQTLEVAGNLIGLTPQRQDLQVAQFATPALKALIEAGTHTNTFTGNAYPVGDSPAKILTESLLGTPDQPNIPLLAAAETAFRHPQTKPFTGPATSQRNYVQEGGIGAALKQLFLGSTRKRELNLTAAQAKGRAQELAAMPPVERAAARTTDAQRALIDEAMKLKVIRSPSQVPGLATAFSDQVAREQAYAQMAQAQGVPENRLGITDRLKADLQLAVARKLVEPGVASGLLRTVSTLNANQVKTIRNTIDHELFPTSGILTELRRAVVQAGGTA